MSSRGKLAVLGAGGFAAEIIEAAELSGWTIDAVYDDDERKQGMTVMGHGCRGTIFGFKMERECAYIIAIGDNEARRVVGEQLGTSHHRAALIVHPSAVVSRSAEISAGGYLAAGVFVGPQARIGAHAIINVGASIGHDAAVGPYAQVCPGARVSGFATLGEGAFVGSNAVLAPLGVMGSWSKLAANSFAAREVPAGKLCVGVPGRIVTI